MIHNDGHRFGKSRFFEWLLRCALESGEHVHAISKYRGERCYGGDDECPLFNNDLERIL